MEKYKNRIFEFPVFFQNMIKIIYYLILEALYPKTNNMESITFDFPLPLGPTILVKLLWNGPRICFPAQDLNHSFSMCVMTNLEKGDSSCHYLVSANESKIELTRVQSMKKSISYGTSQSLNVIIKERYLLPFLKINRTYTAKQNELPAFTM